METTLLFTQSLFIATVIITLFIFYKARPHKLTFFILLMWILIQGILTTSGFYSITNTMPPRLLLMIAPALLCIILLFISKKGRAYIDSFNIKTLTILHVVRIPVEITLYFLFIQKMVPELTTFEGRNFDVLSGLSAPVIWYFAFVKKKLSTKMLLLWNILALGLVLNIVVHGILAAPSAFQQLAFEQPNTAVLYFPFNYLPSVVVPLVLFAHLASIRKISIQLRGKVKPVNAV